MFGAIICLLPVALSTTIGDFVRIYDVSKAVDRDGLNLPALARAIVPHLFEPGLPRPTTAGLEFEVELGGPTLWKCVCSKAEDPWISPDYGRVFYTTEEVKCSHNEVEVVFKNSANYIDLRGTDERREDLVPARYYLEKGTLR